MKKILGIGLIVILLLLASYFITGIITERTLKKDIGLINQSSGFEVNLKDYRRGWFCSKANFDWIFVVPARTTTDNNNQTRIIPAQSYTVVMPLTIYHGPVIFAKGSLRFGFGFAKTKIDLPQEYLNQFNELFKPTSVKPTVNLNVLVSFLNRSRFEIEVPDFKLISKEDGSQFEWQGMNNVIILSGNLNKIKGDLDIHGFMVTKNNRILSFDKINSDYDLNKNTNGLYFGDASISFDSIVAKEKELQRLRLDNLQLISSSNIKNELFDGSIKASFNLLEVHDKRYGPLMINFAVKNLDANALSDINTKVGNLDNSNQMSQQVLWTVLPDLPRLFNRGARIEIKDSILQVPEGQIKLDMELGLSAGDLDNPLAIMQKLQGDGSITITKSVLYNMMLVSQRHQLMQKALQRQTEEEKKQTVVQADVIKIDTQPDSTTTKVEDLTKPETAIKTNEGNRAPLIQDKIQMPKINLAPGPQLTQPQKVTTIDTVLIENQASMEVNRRIKAMLEAGILTQDTNNYIVNLKYSDGKLIINDKPFNSSMLNF